MDPSAPQPNLDWYMYCFVPSCKNTTSSTPEKIFIRVPNNPVKRKVWCDAVGFDQNKKLKKTSYCCEDHLDLENDLKNYNEYKQFGGRKILKENVVPRFNLNIPNNPAHSSMNVDDQFEIQDHGACSLNPRSILQPPVKLYESKLVQVKPSTANKWSQTSIQNEDKASQAVAESHSVCVSCNVDAHLVKQLDTLQINVDVDENMDSSFGTLDTTSSYKMSCSKSSGISNEEEKLRDEILAKVVYENSTKKSIEKNPLLYLGIRKESMYIIDLLHEECGISVRDIYLTLKKVKLNLPFSVLGYEFGFSEPQASRVFKKTVKVIAVQLKQLIVWPSKQQIMLNLPLHFRYRYSDIESIIDCFEIEIEKPSDAYNQALTWSDYKKCNTAKYLISVTADGLINFISDGVCGRCTDMSIVEKCGYLDVLPKNVNVMADRGFKQLDVQLKKKNCTLIRPPSVSQNTRSSRSDVRLTKQIASLRIHVERVIKVVLPPRSVLVRCQARALYKIAKVGLIFTEMV